MVSNYSQLASSDGKFFIIPFLSQDQAMNKTTANGTAALKAKLNGHVNGTTEHEEHDEDQYLDIIRKIMKKGERYSRLTECGAHLHKFLFRHHPR